MTHDGRWRDGWQKRKGGLYKLLRENAKTLPNSFIETFGMIPDLVDQKSKMLVGMMMWVLHLF